MHHRHPTHGTQSTSFLISTRNPVYNNIYCDFFRCVKFLVLHGADANAQDDSGRTALHWACSWGHAWSVRMLCEYGNANVNLTDQKRETPLILAVIDGKVGVVEVIYIIVFSDLL